MRLIMLCCLSCLLCSCTEKKETKRQQSPNVVLIMADDMGWGDLSYNGNKNISTPNIDSIAKNGLVFSNFFVQPVCSPSRAELLTGRHSVRLNVTSTSAGGERMNLGESTIGEVFKAAGYKTAIYGKWHNGMQPPYHPNSRGFDDFYGFASGHWGNYFDPLLEYNGSIVRGEGYLPDDLTNHAIEFAKNNKDEPFLLFLSLNTPHSPMQVPEEYWRRIENDSLKQKHRAPAKEDPLFTKAALAMTENIDMNVGRLLQHLRSLQLEDETIVVFLSDNGPNSSRWNGGMRGRKGSTDEGGVRSPLFIQWSDNLPHLQVGQIASAVDLLPTLAALSGIPLNTSNKVDGMDLSPLFRGEEINNGPRYVFNYWKDSTSVRSQNYRLDHQDRLYDMRNDPGQRNDIADKEKVITKRLKQVKSEWLEEVSPDSAFKDSRPFTLGHPEWDFTQLPARDGEAFGNIIRSNRWPNCSFFTNWVDEEDYISWDVEVLEEGLYDVELYYTCSDENTGAEVELSFEDQSIVKKITEPNDPPLMGMGEDRILRIESYVKDFKPVKMGTVRLSKGRGGLTLKGVSKTGEGFIDVRLLMITRNKASVN